jgi:hypothetical protein
MTILEAPVPLAELRQLSERFFSGLVKAVVDIKLRVMAIDAELHADLEALLLQNGSEQRNLWGINLYPTESADRFIEYDSMINVRPSQNNRSRGVENEDIRQRITEIVDTWVIR